MLQFLFHNKNNNNIVSRAVHYGQKLYQDKIVDQLISVIITINVLFVLIVSITGAFYIFKGACLLFCTLVS